MSITLPSEIAVDLRDPVAGDSYGWEEIEPAAAKKSIVIHATASEAPGEDGFTVAEYHVNHNNWGGCGVHGVVTKDSYPGRPGQTSPGAQLQYVGDLLTWRAGTLDQNPGRIHIEISGLFTPGNGVPSEGQLRKVRAFIDYALAPNNVLPSLNFYSQVTYHNAVPGQNTQCPGWQHPQFAEWFAYLQGGAEPSWWTPAPAQAPAPVAPEQGRGGTVDPTPIPVIVTPPPTEFRTILRDGAYALDYSTGTRIADLPLNIQIAVAEYVNYNEVTGALARTVWAKANNKTNGIPVEFFEAPTGQPSGDIPVTVVPSDSVATNVTDSQLQEATVPLVDKRSVLDIIKELIAALVAKIIRKKKIS